MFWTSKVEFHSYTYDKITLTYCVKNVFNPTSEVQKIENGVFQNTVIFQTGITDLELRNFEFKSPISLVDSTSAAWLSYNIDFSDLKFLIIG